MAGVSDSHLFLADPDQNKNFYTDPDPDHTELLKVVKSVNN
jgi:hypothetical protein